MLYVMHRRRRRYAADCHIVIICHWRHLYLCSSPSLLSLSLESSSSSTIFSSRWCISAVTPNCQSPPSDARSLSHSLTHARTHAITHALMHSRTHAFFSRSRSRSLSLTVSLYLSLSLFHCTSNVSMNEWMNEWMNERMCECMNN